ncbi:O-antigen ligase family protein [Halomarina litorea]|uniref:O-antigen ligase family protein n=1 Tax=Halomarina litorea TaxID=2961595 RepID=UPI0020C310EE|nr:O-antigen ligase family protein [Halomarina sp. BCD28]
MTATLVCTLLFLAPIVGSLLATNDAIPLPLLIGLGIGAVPYIAIVLYKRRFLEGSLAALVVLSTMGADVPILPGATDYPGHVIGDILLVYGAILALGTVLVWRQESFEHSLPTLSLAAFVGWSIVSALFGGGPKSTIALQYSMFMGLGLVVFVLVQHIIRTGYIEFCSLVAMMVVAVAGHTAVAVAQMFNQGAFGLHRLGEGADIVVATASFPFGDVAMGTFVSGFTAMSFNLANLLVLTIPILLVFVARAGRARPLISLWAVVSFGVVRATTTDAGRGGLLVAIVCLCSLLLYTYRRRAISIFRSQSDKWTGSALQIFPAILGPLVVLYPSSAAGESSARSDVTESSNAKPSANHSQEGTTPAKSAVEDPTAVEELLEWLTSSSVPLFDLSNIGIRLQQYLVGIELFVRNPLVGIGGMNYVLMAEQYGITPRPGERLPLPIHNIYVALLAETGLVGFLLYVGTLALVLVYGVRLLRTPATDRSLVAATVAGIVGTLAFGFWDILQLYSGTGFFPLWILAGAIVGEYSRVTH